MMNKLTYIFLVTLLFIFQYSCEEPSYPEFEEKIVIDGWIEYNRYPRVFITTNTPFITTMDSLSFRKLILSNISVFVSDGDKTEGLTFHKNKDYFPPYYYEGSEIKGQVGKKYSVTVIQSLENGEERIAYAETTVPAPVTIDTSWSEVANNNDTLHTVWLTFTDNKISIDYYRVLTKRLGKDKKYHAAAVMSYSDQFFNGKQFDLQVLRGPENFLEPKNDVYFRPGDTLSIKFSTIDKASYDFWVDFQNEMLNAGNPFAASLTTVRSNIQGEGLGIWCGYGLTQFVIEIPE